MDSDEDWFHHSNKSKARISTKFKCRFCAAFFSDELLSAVHSESCVARLSAFLASDGRIKFACMVCRDVFDGQSELSEHEQLHIYPGGFGCTVCNATFMSDRDRVRHTEAVHKKFKCLRCEHKRLISTEALYVKHCEKEHNGEGGYAICLECGAGFEEKSQLRFHSETECGHFRGWTCIECAAIFPTEIALNEHIGSHLSNGIKRELECDNILPLEFASTECTSNLNGVKTLERSSNEDAADCPFYDPMEIDQSQYSDDEQSHKESLDLVKEEAADPIDGESDGEQQDALLVEADKSTVWSMDSDDVDVKKYECKTCNESFSTATEEKQHRKQHQSVTTCRVCGKSFENFTRLRYHLRAHKNTQSFQCKYCSLKFNIKARMLAHLAKHTGVKNFQCLACMERFATLTKLQSHRKLQKKTCGLVKIKSEYFMDAEELEPRKDADEENSISTEDNGAETTTTAVKQQVKRWVRLNDLEFNCHLCDQKYAQKKSLEKHVARHGPDGKLVHKCDCCPQFFATVAERDEHKNKVHLIEMTCSHCNKVCRNVDRLKAHLRNSHQGRTKEKQQHICSKCGATFSAKFLLENHEKSDCGRIPIYVCKECGKCLGTEYTYRAHLRIHREDTKSFICSYCNKGWRSKHGLDTHLRYHTGEKPYACSYCDKRFFDRTSKKTHESTHTGIKPYMCQCGDRFSCISNLQSHRRARKTTCGLLPLVSKAFPQMSPETIGATGE